MALKGQSSTEYLVIMAVMLIVSLLAAGVLGQFVNLGSDLAEQQSKSYWRYASPFSIQSAKLSGSDIYLEIRNELDQRINLTAIYFDGSSLGIEATYFAPGQSHIVNGTLAAYDCVTGRPYEFKNVTFYYSQGPVGGLAQAGSRSMYGMCT